VRNLPDYAWASSDPAIVGVPEQGWRAALDPIASIAEVEILPDAPTVVEADLVPVHHPRIRVLSAYFHEGWPFAHLGAWLRPAVYDRLQQAVETLPEGFGLAIWDAWRDPRLQADLHDTVYADESLPPGFVAYPDPDPRHCPPHASGGTVDLTLTFRNVPLSLGTLFDAFVPHAAAAALEPDGDPLARDLRRLLATIMSQAGFVQHPQEWWHWEYGTRYWAAATGNPVLFGHAVRPGDRFS
jgi:D-alanyl-D-alanine dipeptidase